MAVYFSTFELGMKMFVEEGEPSTSAPIAAAFLAGGLSGMCSWLFTYPIDYVKTLVQSDDLDNRKFKSAVDCARKQYSAEGYKTFFKGLGVTMLRSFPVNGVGFLAF
jgi:solute carrier family 25 carnitine/acylcarnitine transporter 20/29